MIIFLSHEMFVPRRVSSIAIHGTLEGTVDTILLAGGVSPWEPSAEFIQWLRSWATRVRRLCSVCTGTFILAAAGFLEGRRATTHWRFCHQLATAYPGVKVDPEPIFIRDDNIYTSAGVTAGMDLALALVEEDFGADVALRIARAFVLFLRRPGGQSQFSVALNLKPTSRSLLGDLHLWIIDHLNEPLTVETLAAQAAMSPRNFSRIFVQEYRITPAKFVEQLRLETARRRLEESSDGVKRIATETGLGSSESMRRLFLRHLRVTPSEYRSRFQTHFLELNATVKETRRN